MDSFKRNTSSDGEAGWNIRMELEMVKLVLHNDRATQLQRYRLTL